jgi:hypothetical protein
MHEQSGILYLIGGKNQNGLSKDFWKINIEKAIEQLISKKLNSPSVIDSRLL